MWLIFSKLQDYLAIMKMRAPHCRKTSIRASCARLRPVWERQRVFWPVSIRRLIPVPISTDSPAATSWKRTAFPMTLISFQLYKKCKTKCYSILEVSWLPSKPWISVLSKKFTIHFMIWWLHVFVNLCVCVQKCWNSRTMAMLTSTDRFGKSKISTLRVWVRVSPTSARLSSLIFLSNNQLSFDIPEKGFPFQSFRLCCSSSLVWDERQWNWLLWN